MNWNELYKFLISINLTIILLLGICLNIFTEASFSFGFLAGSIIMLLNFHAMQKNIRALFIKSENNFFIKNPASIIPKFYFRLAIIGIIVYILLDQKVDPLGLTLGLFTFVGSIIITGIYYGIRLNKNNRG